MTGWYPVKRDDTTGDPILYVDFSKVIYVRKNYATGKAVLGFKSTHEADAALRDSRNDCYNAYHHELNTAEKIEDVMMILSPAALLTAAIRNE